MPIKQLTPKQQIQAHLARRIAALEQVVVLELEAVALEVLRHARSPQRSRYKDQTGNLTSSIGYAIVVNGKVSERSSFDVVLKGAEGTKSGSAFLKEVISQYPKGIVFVMVAGMPYAQYVEAMNLDVLDSAEQMAKRMVPQILKKLKLK